MKEYAIARDEKGSWESPERIAQLFDAAFRRGEIRKGARYEFNRVSKRFVECARSPGRTPSRVPAFTRTKIAARRRVQELELDVLRSKARGF
jgi:hypothetical protein